jgi:hypothetical protein
MRCATGQSAVGWCGQARVSHGAWVCVLSLKLFGLSGVASFLCVVLSRRGLLVQSYNEVMT